MFLLVDTCQVSGPGAIDSPQVASYAYISPLYQAAPIMSRDATIRTYTRISLSSRLFLQLRVGFNAISILKKDPPT